MIGMSPIPGYQTRSRIYQSSSSAVYRARREKDGLPVVLKVLRGEYPSLPQILRYKQEYKITEKLKNVPGVIGVHGLERYGNTLAMVLEDFGGDSLEIHHRFIRFDLYECISISICIVDALGRIHAADVIHKDLTPSNVVYNSGTKQLKIIDFGISTELSFEDPAMESPEVLEGTLAYVSPEQTGRMNRTLDYRTDYYSLGATLYQLFTGRPPFETTDALEMVHSHIARKPVPPHRLNPEIPQAVSEIVMKLLSKNSEDRYQSARGIKLDLTECLERLESQGTIEPFVVGRNDFSERFQIPQKLYGRDLERGRLLDAFGRVTLGAKEMVLVSGPPGIGKTSLVREIYRPVTEHRAYFVSGKFDQFGRNVPYAAIVKAFRDLMRRLLTESQAGLDRWKERLRGALGESARVIIDVIPELGLIMGPQPAVPEISPMESINRFNRLISRFIRVFCSSDHPLVLFLDDLQWADMGSLKLLELMMTDDDTRSLLVIGAFRRNEVDSSHPLQLQVESLRRHNVLITDIALNPLSPDRVTDLIADSLSFDEEKVRPLSKLVVAKTAGNPFFTREFLKSIYQAKLLQFDSTHGKWQWDLQKIEARAVADNVVDLMSRKISNLAGETQTVVKLAACIGNRFELGTLAVVCETPESRTLDALKVALFEGLVIPLGDAWKLVDLEIGEPPRDISPEFKFCHDRIQQAAYSLISDSEKPSLHRRIGHLLFRDLPLSMENGRVFDVVNHLNLGLKSVSGSSEKYELAGLNLLAGRKATMSAAYEPAFQYFKQGIGLLEPDCWENQYELTRDLHLEGGWAAYLSADFEEMERLTKEVLQNAASVLDKSKAYELRIQALIAGNEMSEAVRVGATILRLLGVSVPEHPTRLQALYALIKTKLILMGRSIESLDGLPEMKDPQSAAAIRIMSGMAQAAYVACPELIPPLLFHAINLSLKQGNAPESAFMYACYGLVLAGLLGQFDSAYQYGKLALRLSDRFNAAKLKLRTSTVVYFFINPWKEHYSKLADHFKDMYHRGLETGNLEDAGLAAYIYCTGSFRTGRELPLLKEEMSSYCDALIKLKQESAHRLLVVYRQALLNLMGESDDPCRLIGEAYDEETMLPLHRQADDRSAVCVTYLNKLLLCYVFHHYSDAVENADNTAAFLDGVRGTPAVPIFYFYDSLARLATYEYASARERKAILKRVKSNQKKMTKWAHHGPMNHVQKLLLVEAERSRVTGRHFQAERHYDASIAAARENGYINEEALANELASKFYLDKGRTNIARAYMLDARSCYERWGAQAKVKHLDDKYDILDSEEWNSGTAIQGPHSERATLRAGPRGDLDLAWVMKATRAISGEIVLGELLSKLLNIMIENAGARKGFLVREHEGNLFIEASVHTERNEVRILQSLSIEESVELPASVIKYVARTMESLLLNDAAKLGQFVDDPYVMENQPQSILCFPLVHKGKLSAIVYLENNLTPDAFSRDHLETLKLLGSQAAISLENARLYDELDRRVRTRTEQLNEALIAAKTASRAKSEFLATMSHELRTPLNAVIGFSELLEDQGYGEMNKDQLTFVQQIHGAGEHLLQLINDILDLAKIESGKLELQPQPLRPGLLLRNSVSMIRDKALKREIRLDLHIDDQLDAGTIQADDVKLKQIMFNLLSNAVKFTPDGGAIAVRASQESGSMVVSVSDTGIGIRPGDFERVFGAFEQVDSSHSRRQQGTGLGLALTRRLVELHGGRIRVESDGPGKGSTFTFTIPLAPVSVQETEIV